VKKENASKRDRFLFNAGFYPSGLNMFEVMGLVLTGGEIKRYNAKVPGSVAVNVEVTKMTKQDENNVVLDFNYVVDYKPKVGHLKITGKAYCKDYPANIKKALADFRKKKYLPMEYGASVINMINANAGMNSIFLIRPFNLIPPFMPPLITTEGKPSSAKPKKRKK
jgi:hypothetical protein